LKLKYISGVRMNVDWIPQDWRFDFTVYVPDGKEKKIDVRVSFMPWLRGESVVMRFLDSTKWIMSFTQIWFIDDALEILQRNLRKNYWMILVTWPTGSWKTTTLYSMLNFLNDPWKKIITLEDPVEYELPGIQQSQINEKKGYTYEEWLKAILRQDPDIIMVWEIRTKETAEIAINAALTWHLVLSTLHTNTAIEAISRLLNMWIKPYLLAPALNLVIWQRLVRKLHSCFTRRDANMAEEMEIKDFIKRYKDVKQKTIKFNWKVPEPTGCEECWYDWYFWRIAIVETFEVNDDIKTLITTWKSVLDLYSLARQYWYITMKEDGYLKVLKWLTTLEEIRRVI
jgi:type IV pilus assembly protein PilB